VAQASERVQEVVVSPIYVYACECGHNQEKLRPVADRDLDLECKRCGKTLKRVPTTATLAGEKYRMAGILPSGEKVKGHFGK